MFTRLIKVLLAATVLAGLVGEWAAFGGQELTQAQARPAQQASAPISTRLLAPLALPETGEPPAVQAPPIDPAAPGTLTAEGDTLVSVDDLGYITWRFDLGDSTSCIPVGLRWPIDLGEQNPKDLSDASLTIKYYYHTFVKYGWWEPPDNPNRSWDIGVNSEYAENSWLDWSGVGAIQALNPGGRILHTDVITFQAELLQDGVNNFFTRSRDHWDESGESPECVPGERTLGTTACSCIQMVGLELRAAPRVKPETPAEGLYIPFQQDLLANDPYIQAKFSAPPDPDSVNEQTFEVWYYDRELNPVMVGGKINPVDEKTFQFVPHQSLKNGVLYHAQVWGKLDAQANERQQWVKDKAGNPVDESITWNFWTLPDLKVELIPVQVLEGVPLVTNKPAALRVFMRWEEKPDVFALHQLDQALIHDIKLSWQSPGGGQDGGVAWTEGYGWLPKRDAQTALRKREYLEFNDSQAAYSPREKLASKDSVIFTRFMPLESGTYDLKAEVQLLDKLGKIQTFDAQWSPTVVDTRRYQTYWRPLAVGSNYGKTGTVDMHFIIQEYGEAIKAIFPVSGVRRPSMPTAIPWDNNWGWSYQYEPMLTPWHRSGALRYLNNLCGQTPGCDLMYGLVTKAWQGYPGATLPSYPQAALVQLEASSGHRNFVAAHEAGHTVGFEHIPPEDEFNVNDPSTWMQSSDGFEVLYSLERPIQDKRRSVYALNNKYLVDFMNVEPYRDLVNDAWIWINESRYNALLARFTNNKRGNAPEAPHSDEILLASGSILESSGEVQLDPWYVMEPRAWEAPLPGPYHLVFLDESGQEILGYRQAFTTSTPLSDTEPAFFSLVTAYPAATAKVELRNEAENVLTEIIPGASAPELAVDTPTGTTWSGAQELNWHSDPGQERYYAVNISTDNGQSWEPLVNGWITPSLTLETSSLANTSQALVHIMASDGLRTTRLTAGPYTISNSPVVAYGLPGEGATGIEVETQVIAGFRDPMDAASLNGESFYLASASGEHMAAEISYDPLENEAVLWPQGALAYATTYTATLTAGATDAAGRPLGTSTSWAFRTLDDNGLPPAPIVFSPANGAQQVGLDSQVMVLWDKDLLASSINPISFTLETAGGESVSGIVSYDAASRSAHFAPDADLAVDTLYIARLQAGIQDLTGNRTQGEYHWAFHSGKKRAGEMAFSGAFSDYGLDEDGDGRYESLLIQVGVQVTETADYELSGRLEDAGGGQIGAARTRVNLTAGTHFIALVFDGAQIGGRGVDGPYTLTGLGFFKLVGDEVALDSPILTRMNAYQTFAYRADQFASSLRFGGLPDLRVPPGSSLNPAFNVHAYASHPLYSSQQLTYTLVENTFLEAGVSLDANGNINISPDPGWTYDNPLQYMPGKPGWTGVNQVSIQVTDGETAVLADFRVTVGWAGQAYLPLVGRSSDFKHPTPDYWRTALKDDFEDQEASAGKWGQFVEVQGKHQWQGRECAAYDGSYSFWALGAVTWPAPGLEQCGAQYPNSEHLAALSLIPANLEYASAAELSMKVMTDLASGDQFCALAAGKDVFAWASYAGICRSGQTDGWEDLSLNLANVPILGNLLGEKDVRVALDFSSNASGTRPFGVYVDDLSLRVCLDGLPCEGAPPNPAPLPLVQGAVGGFTNKVLEAALAVEANGRIHALWSGELPYLNQDEGDFTQQRFVFYSTSSDGVNWTRAQALAANGASPQVVVDDAHGRVHLVYSTATVMGGKVMHHTVTDGVLSAGMQVAQGSQPHLAVDPFTGYAHLVWQEFYWKPRDTAALGWSGLYRTGYAWWDGTRWAPRQPVINSGDTFDPQVAAAPGGGVMLAWFQGWSQALGDSTGPSDPILPNTAFGEPADGFALRQRVGPLYEVPESDGSIRLVYSPVDEKFYLVTGHFMWPEHSRVYRYVWQDGIWAGPLDVVGNLEQRADPVHLGAATGQARVNYVYLYDWATLWLRSEVDGVLSAPENLSAYLEARGYNGEIYYFTGADGALHMLIAGAKDGIPGLYYLKK